MSTRSHAARQGVAPLTHPRWYPTTQGLNRWVNGLAERADLAIRVLKNTNGAPARFVPGAAEIDINEGVIARIDPVEAGSPDFVAKHPAEAGALIHEAAHAMASTMDLAAIARTYGDRHAAVFALLEEGRAECSIWPKLTPVERTALQSMVLDIVLKDMVTDDGEQPEMNLAAIVRLTGLLSARVHIGIVDTTQPMASQIVSSLRDVLGEDYDVLFGIAVRFSMIRLGWYGDQDRGMHDLVREWMKVEDRIRKDEPKPEGPTEPGEPGGEPGEPSDEGDGDGEGDDKPSEPKGKPKGKGKGKPDSQSESEDEGEGDGADKGDDADADSEGDGEGEGDGKGEGEGDESKPGEPKADPTIGDDDEGEEGDGTEVLEQTGDGDSETGLGDYSSAATPEDVLKDIFDTVRKAADEAEHVSGSRMKEQLVAIHRATAAAHKDRRAKNKEAKKKWR